MKTIILLFVSTCLTASWVFAEVRGSAEWDCNADACYFLSKGHIYKSQIGEQNGHLVRNSDGVQSIMTFKGRLYALRKDGTVWVFEEKSPLQWIRIAKDTQQLQADDTNLFIIKRNNTLGKYDGSNFAYNPQTEYGKPTTTVVENVFSYPGIISVKTMSSPKTGQRQTQIEYLDGKIEDFYGQAIRGATKEVGADDSVPKF
jgi:hypothetical protein